MGQDEGAERSQPAEAQTPTPAMFQVERFTLAGLAAWGVEEAPTLGALRVRLRRTGEGWIAAPPEDEQTPVRTLRQIRSQGPMRFDDSALAQIAQGVPAWMLEALGKEYNGQRTPRYAHDEATGVVTISVEPPGPAPGESVFSIASVRAEGLTGRGLNDSDIAAIEVPLTRVEGGFIDAREGLPVERRALGEIAGEAERVELYSSALQAMAEAVVRAYNERGLRGIRVDVSLPDPEAGEAALRITEGSVGDVRTVTMGGDGEETVDAPRHSRIVDASPVRSGDLVDIASLDNYVFRLNRRPARRVDVALAPGPGDDELTLDYLVAESSALTLYAQASNTGTEETSEYRERFGLNHYNLSGVDDTLLLDYVTGDFDEVHALLLSYERPFGFLSDWSWRAFASYSEYDASQVGFPGQSFEGQTIGAGAELSWTFHQDRELFLDAVGGVRYDNTEVDNSLAATEVDNDFLLPYLGVKLERVTERSQTHGLAMFESNFSDLAGTDDGVTLDGLGRINADDDWTVFRYELSHSFYLEPLLQDDWGGEGSTLAHEVYLSARGQVSLDNRLPPNFTQTAGGLYSVRGHPESFTFGDRVYLATAEYRFHWPRTLSPGEPVPGILPNQQFRARPQQWLSRPDWDLILRAFFDAGVTDMIDQEAFEQQSTLLGAGFGVELSLRRRLSVRMDWGFALRDERVTGDSVDQGSSQVHLVMTLVF